MANEQILIVEDELLVAMDLQDSLERLGYRVPGVVAYGEEVLQKTAETQPDLVLMDIMLSGDMNGIEAAEHIRDQLGIPVVYLTAYADDETLRRARVTVPFGYIIKPFEERELHMTIQMALYWHRMEMELVKNKQWLATTLNSIGDAVVALDPKGRITFMNPVAEALTGWDQKEALGKAATDVIHTVHEHTYALTASAIARVLREDVQVGLADHILIAKDGTEIPIDESAAPIRDDKGNMMGVVLVFRDVSKRRRMEEALWRSATLDRVRAEVFRMRKTGDLQSVLTAIYRELRATAISFHSCSLNVLKEETEPPTFKSYCIGSEGVRIIGTPTAGGELIRKVWHGGKPMYRRDLDAEDVYEEKGYMDRIWGKPIRSVVDVPFSKGTLALNSVKADAFSEQDIELLRGFAEVLSEGYTRMEDLERIEQSEEKYRSVVEHSQDVIFRLDPEGNYLLISPAVEQLTGYSPEEFYADRTIGSRIVLPEDREKGLEGFRRASTGAISRDVEYRVKGRDGTMRWMSQNTFPIQDAQGRIIAMEGTIRDITEHKQAEEEKAQLEAQLLQAQKMEAIGQLAGGVAHDFNNLLTTINGFSELLLMELDPSHPVYRDVQEIKQAGQRAASITYQLLAFSRKQILQPKVLDLNTVIANTDKMLRRLIGEDVELVVLLDPDLGLVKVDPAQVQQVLLNLAINARDAMPQGGKLSIETMNVDLDEAYAQQHGEVQPGPYVMMAIRDTGVGMDEDTQSRMFEPFFTTKEAGKGTGLGLSTVYGIVRQSGGHIRCSSARGKGTTFMIYLPRVENEKDPLPLHGEEGYLPFGRETVLLVEDEPSVLRMATRVLGRQGYRVLEALNGEDALRVAEEYAGEGIDLLATDVVMPLMGGKVLAERLREVYPELRVLYTSGYTDDVVLHHGVLNGGIGFLQKPFSPGALAQKVREVLDG